MSVWAIVPIKPLNRAKSRLANVLSNEQRYDLALEMLRRCLQALSDSDKLAGILVISRDMKALSEARAMADVQTLQESGTPELNNALIRASNMLISWRAGATLIIPADLPLIHAHEIAEIVEQGVKRNTVILSPDRNKDGTNMLFCRPPGLVPLEFGVGSFDRHRQVDENGDISVIVYESERLSVDVDTPDDLSEYVKIAQKLGEDPIIDYP